MTASCVFTVILMMVLTVLSWMVTEDEYKSYQMMGEGHPRRRYTARVAIGMWLFGVLCLTNAAFQIYTILRINYG